MVFAKSGALRCRRTEASPSFLHSRCSATGGSSRYAWHERRAWDAVGLRDHFDASESASGESERLQAVASPERLEGIELGRLTADADQKPVVATRARSLTAPIRNSVRAPDGVETQRFERVARRSRQLRGIRVRDENLRLPFRHPRSYAAF